MPYFPYKALAPDDNVVVFCWLVHDLSSFCFVSSNFPEREDMEKGAPIFALKGI